MKLTEIMCMLFVIWHAQHYRKKGHEKEMIILEGSDTPQMVGTFLGVLNDLGHNMGHCCEL